MFLFFSSFSHSSLSLNNPVICDGKLELFRDRRKAVDLTRKCWLNLPINRLRVGTELRSAKVLLAGGWGKLRGFGKEEACEQLKSDKNSGVKERD